MLQHLHQYLLVGHQSSTTSNMQWKQNVFYFLRMQQTCWWLHCILELWWARTKPSFQLFTALYHTKFDTVVTHSMLKQVAIACVSTPFNIVNTSKHYDGLVLTTFNPKQQHYQLLEQLWTCLWTKDIWFVPAAGVLLRGNEWFPYLPNCFGKNIRNRGGIWHWQGWWTGQSCGGIIYLHRPYSRCCGPTIRQECQCGGEKFNSIICKSIITDLLLGAKMQILRGISKSESLRI